MTIWYVLYLSKQQIQWIIYRYLPRPYRQDTLWDPPHSNRNPLWRPLGSILWCQQIRPYHCRRWRRLPCNRIMAFLSHQDVALCKYRIKWVVFDNFDKWTSVSILHLLIMFKCWLSYCVQRFFKQDGSPRRGFLCILWQCDTGVYNDVKIVKLY